MAVSPVPSMVFYLASQVTPNRVAAGVSLLESIFYSCLKAGTSGRHEAIKWAKESAFARVHEIQFLFSTLNVGQILYYSSTLVPLLQKQFTCSWLPIFGAMAATAALITASFIRCRPTSIPETINQCEVKEKHLSSQTVAQVLETCKMVLVLSHAYFSGDRLSLAVNLATSAYSLAKNYKLKWLEVTKTFNFQFENLSARDKDVWIMSVRDAEGGHLLDQSTNPPTYCFSNIDLTGVKATVGSHVLLLEPGSTTTDDTCSVCYVEGSEEPFDAAFCIDHLYHKQCIGRSVAFDSNRFLEGSFFRNIATRYYRDGSYTHTRQHYKVYIIEEKLPRCPQCRGTPWQNKLFIKTMKVPIYGLLRANVTILRAPVNWQTLFEKFYACYSVVQAGLAYLQKYPELAGVIYRIQEVLIILDLFCLLATCVSLSEYIKEDSKGNETAYSKRWSSAVIKGLAIAALSFVAVDAYQHYFKPAIVLNDLIKQLPLAANIIQNTDAIWTNPMTTTLMQCLYLCRIASTVALARFSKQPRLNWLSVAAQFYSLFGVSQLRWMEITQLFSNPAEVRSLAWLETRSTFMVNSACAKDVASLTSTLQSIMDQLGKLLDKSTWSSYWMIHTRNGVETSRVLHYVVALQKNALNLSTPWTYFYKLAFSGFDRKYGSVFITYAATS